MLAAFSEAFYWQWRRKGFDVKRRAIDSPSVRTLEQARAWAMAKAEAEMVMKEAEGLGLVASLKGRIAAFKGGRFCTVGQFIEAFLLVARRHNVQMAENSVARLRLVIAVAQGWLVPGGGKRIDGNGGELVRRVDALPMPVVCKETSDAYMLACQVAAKVAVAGKGGAWELNLDTRNPPLVNRTINSTLGNAAVPVGERYREFEVADLVVPWDVVANFAARRLPAAAKDVSEELPGRVQFETMLQSWRALREADEELALVNEMLRRLGLRSGELVMARESWLVVGRDGRTFLEVRNRADEGWSCKSHTAGKLPLTDDMAARLRARCEAARGAGLTNPFLVLPMLPGGSYNEGRRRSEELPARAQVVRERHNAWLKEHIGESRTRQGNHRLRKYVATQIYWAEVAKHGDENRAAGVVKRYLRQSKEATALLHYIAKRDELAETVTDEALSVDWS
jgi:hypothetical protein